VCMARPGVWWLAMIVAAVLCAEAQAEVPPQPPSAHRLPAKRTLPPPSDPVSEGLSLEHACLNAVRATRHSPKMMQPDPASDPDPNRAAAIEHLDAAEQAARAGHGQVCEQELALAEEKLN
jgi:hypothetical protein